MCPSMAAISTALREEPGSDEGMLGGERDALGAVTDGASDAVSSCASPFRRRDSSRYLTRAVSSAMVTDLGCVIFDTWLGQMCASPACQRSASEASNRMLREWTLPAQLRCEVVLTE